MPRNLYWGKVNWNAPYNRRGLWTLNYIRSAANARPLFALLVVVYPTYFCRILCLLGVLTERYRTPVYFQHAVLFLLTRAHPRARILSRSRTDALKRVMTEMKMRKPWAETVRPKTFARVLSTCLSMHTLEIDFHSKGCLILFSAQLMYALSDTYFRTIPKSLSHSVNPLNSCAVRV